MRYANVPFQHIYLVSDKQHLVAPDALVAVERELGCALPEMYKQYLQLLGHGIYCDHIRLFSPDEILERNRTLVWTKDTSWAAQSVLVTPELIDTSILLADTTEGDHIIFSPHTPDTVYVLLRGAGYRQACIAPRGFRDLMLWIDEERRFASATSIPYFTPQRDRKTRVLTATDTNLLFLDVKHAIEQAVGKPVQLQSAQTYAESVTTTCLIPAIRGVISVTEEVDERAYSLHMMCSVDYDTDFAHAAQPILEHLEQLGFH